MTTDNIYRKAHTRPMAPSAKTENQQGSRWQRGVSGNPKGRPQGSRHRATRAALQLLEGDLEKITRKLVETAIAGEAWAITLVMNKLIPTPKDSPVTFAAPRLDTATDLRVALTCILRAVSRGELTPQEALAVSGVVGSLGLAMQVEELEAEIEQLQGAQA